MAAAKNKNVGWGRVACARACRKSSGPRGTGRGHTSRLLPSRMKPCAHTLTQSGQSSACTLRTGASSGDRIRLGSAGLIAMPVTIPADVPLYVTAARMVAAIAHIRGYDVDLEEVRTDTPVAPRGGAGAAVARLVQDRNKIVIAQPGRLSRFGADQDQPAVGFRVGDQAGAKGRINLAKVVPVVGGGVGAINVGTF